MSDQILTDPPWVVEIDGIKIATQAAVVLLLKAVSEERDALREALELWRDFSANSLEFRVFLANKEKYYKVFALSMEALDA